MSEPTKSVLDNIPVDDREYYLKDTNKLPNHKIGERLLSVVGHCPSCGGPIYGPREIAPSTVTAAIRYSCQCWRKTGTIENKEKI